MGKPVFYGFIALQTALLTWKIFGFMDIPWAIVLLPAIAALVLIFIVAVIAATTGTDDWGDR